MSIYYLGSFFGGREKEKTDLITEKSCSFLVEKDTKKSKINLQIVNVSGEKTEITDQIFHNILIWKIGRKRKKVGGFWFH